MSNINAAMILPQALNIQPTVALTRDQVEALLDLVENKTSCMDVIDREDARQMNLLTGAKEALQQAFPPRPKRFMAKPYVRQTQAA